MKIQHQVSPTAYHSEGFIGKYQRLVKDVMIPYQYRVLCDRAEGAEKSHVVQNFINAARAIRGEDTGDGFYGMVFQDSDAGKWLEAVAYSLAILPDAALEADADQLIDLIADAQEKDGYLNTYYTIKDRDKRWTNLQEGHELYCAGHLMEAACAYYETTGKRKLLDVMLRNADHIYRRFIEEGKPGYPGHPEVELALIRMYRVTGNRRCLDLAAHFINVRGVDPDYYAKELAARDWSVWGNDPANHDYQQSGRPVREQKDAVGHAVRAVYLYTAMADLASVTNDESLVSACRVLWDSITHRRMYLTGGIGSTNIGEAFTVDYDLPGDTSYTETCASIGLMFFASRMLEQELIGEYADIMETAFYNTVLGGLQLDGKSYYYVNPLECIPGISGKAATHQHALPARPGWYACACCPPNVARLISSYGKYAYGENEDTAFCHMIAAGHVAFENGMAFKCETDYPYAFTVTYRIEKGGKLALRIPGWSQNTRIDINGKTLPLRPVNGYQYMRIGDGDVVRLELDDSVRTVYASMKIPQLTGKVALCRGPLVYCFEGVDNDQDVLSLALKRGGRIAVAPFDVDLLGGTVSLSMDAVRRKDSGCLYNSSPHTETDVQARAIPYYTWANRGENQMRVWMDEIN